MANIIEQDQIITSIAKIIYQSSRPKEWSSGLAIVRISRIEEEGGRVEYEYLDLKGKPDNSLKPEKKLQHELYLLALKHWNLTKLTSTPWYEMKLSVKPDGKFSLDFTYNPEYKRGDINID